MSHTPAPLIPLTSPQVLGLPNVFGTTQGWPWLLGGVALPAALQLLLQPFLVESPRWLLSCGAYGKAQLNLAVLRGCEPENEDLAEELASMLPEGIEAPRGKGPGGFGSRLLLEKEDTVEYTVRDLLSDRQVRWPLTVCVTLMALQQLSGINNAFNYSSTFLARNGLEPAVLAPAQLEPVDPPPKLSTVHPTLHPTPYTPHPTPYTLHPTP